MEVYELYKDMMYNASYRILQNEHDAQDTVHDAFIKAFQNISKLGDDLRLGGWLKRIVINCALDLLRRKKSLMHLQETIEIYEESDEEDVLEIELKLEEVKEALSRLKDKYRIVLVLYLIENYTHKEIAQELELNESTVRNQYRRGKKLLKKQLQLNY